MICENNIGITHNHAHAADGTVTTQILGVFGEDRFLPSRPAVVVISPEWRENQYK